MLPKNKPLNFRLGNIHYKIACNKMLLTKRVDRAITRHFSVWLQLTATNGFYYDSKQQLFFVFKNYGTWFWRSAYYLGYFICILLMVFVYSLYHDTFSSDTHLISQQSNLLTLLCEILLWFLLTFIMSFGSVVQQERETIVGLLNQLLVFDKTYSAKFNRYISSAKDVKHFVKNMEIVLGLMMYVPICAPFILAISIFTPSDPIRALLQFLFEIQFGLEISTIAAVALVMLAALDFAAALTTPMFLMTTYCYEVIFWLQKLTPMKLKPVAGLPSAEEESRYVGNTSLGWISSRNIVLLYRSFQILCADLHQCVAKLRIAYHVSGIMLLAVISSFVVIKYFRILVSGARSVEIMLALILLAVCFFSVFSFYVECVYLDRVEISWQQYCKAIRRFSKRKDWIFKVAKSFRKINCPTTVSFCNVNKSTFLEWVDVATNNLVTLLMT